MGEIYIVENKSVAAYLRQLEKMGEDAEDYASIWGYTHGQTEPRFGLYVYPDFPFGGDRPGEQSGAGVVGRWKKQGPGRMRSAGPRYIWIYQKFLLSLCKV